MAGRFLAAALALACLAFPCAASAQDRNSSAAERAGPVTYSEQLAELGRVLGGSHYLRMLCNGRGDQRWRDYMREIMSREPGQTQTLAAAFNEGFRREEVRFSVCGRDSQQMEAELRAQGLRLAGALSARNSGARPDPRPDQGNPQ